MAAVLSTPNAPGVFTLTRGKIFLAVSLALTWWLAHLLPHYRPLIRAELRSRLDEARQKIPSIKVDWHPTDDPAAAYNASKVALIIEPRVVPHLVSQILHMIYVVPADWRFLYIGSDKSILSLGRSQAIKHQIIIGKLDLMIMPNPWEIDTKENVYRMLTDMRFYDEFLPGVEWLLKFESDSIMCANAESSLNDWLEWSWAGAPRAPDDRFAGNGGLSLRRVSAIRRVLSFQYRYNNTEPEDEWFGKRLWILPGEKVAAAKEGALAVENVYLDKAMGFHVPDGGKNLAETVWKDHKQRQHIFEYCPEISLVMNMKLERERCDGDDKQGVIHPTDEERAAEAAERKKKEEEENKRIEEARKKLEEEKKKKEEEEKKKKEEEEKEKQKQEEEKKKKKEKEDKEALAKLDPEEIKKQVDEGLKGVTASVLKPAPTPAASTADAADAPDADAGDATATAAATDTEAPTATSASSSSSATVTWVGKVGSAAPADDAAGADDAPPADHAGPAKGAEGAEDEEALEVDKSPPPLPDAQ